MPEAPELLLLPQETNYAQNQLRTEEVRLLAHSQGQRSMATVVKSFELIAPHQHFFCFNPWSNSSLSLSIIVPCHYIGCTSTIC